MVTIEYIINSAMQHYTAIADAFLKAVGIQRTPKSKLKAGIYELSVVEEYESGDTLRLMRNYESPLDGRI